MLRAATADMTATSRPDILAHDDYFSLSRLSPAAYVSLGSMEGMDEQALVGQAPASPARASRFWPGYLLAAAVTGLGYALHYLPFAPFVVFSNGAARRPVSAAILAIVLGVLIRNLFRASAFAAPGCKLVVRKVLPGTIILTGAGLNLLTLTQIGLSALIIVIVGISFATLAGLAFGRWLGLRRQTALLIGAGTAICGNSAIVAVAPLVEANDEDLVLSIATVNLYGMLAMLALPIVGGLFRMGDGAFGVLAGATVHSVPQAIAAGFAYSPAAGALATLVKLVRVTLLAPLVFFLAVHYARRHRTSSGPGQRPAVHFARLVPWFVWGFVSLSLLNTLGLIPALEFSLPAGVWGAERAFAVSLVKVSTELAALLLTLAMAAIGLELDIRLLVGTGTRAVLTGLAATVVLGTGCMLLVFALL